MSIKKFLMLFALPLALVLGGCEGMTPDAGGILPEFELTDATGAGTNKVEFPAEGGELTLNITANRAWSIAVAADWFAVTPSSQPNADHKSITTQVKFNAFANTTSEARQAEITISIEGFGDAKLTVSQLAEGQVATGKVIYYDNFDKVVAVKDGDYWPYMSAEYGNPSPANQTGVTYDSKNVTARSNSGSDSDYSDYEGSGGNNMFFGKENHLTISGISLAELEGNALTLTFGTEKYSQDNGSVFTPSEFHVYISGDGQKWSELSYTFAGTAEGRWNVATAQFSLKEVPSTLAVQFIVDVASSYRMDDLTIYAGGGGTEIDLSQGTAIGGGNSTPVTPTDQPTNLVKATIAEFLAASVDNTTWYELTGTITSIAKEDYGNFYIKDDTDQVYIYGMTNGWVGSNDKSFASIGLKVGDIVTLGTLRGVYNDVPQGGGNTVPAFYISHVEGEAPSGMEIPEGASVAEVVCKDLGIGNSKSVDGQTIKIDDNISMVFAKGSAGTAPAYYDSGMAIRMYQNGATLDVTAANGKTIVGIELTFADNQCYLSADKGELSDEGPVRIWTGEASTIKFTSTGTDKNHRAYIQAIKVAYK